MNMHYIKEATMADVLSVIATTERTSAAKRRAMVSALSSLERLTGKQLAELPATVPELRKLFATVHPHAKDIRPKTLANIKSLCLSAISFSELVPGVVRKSSKGRPKSPEWAALWNTLKTRAERNNLSRLVNFCNDDGVSPQQVDSAVIEQMIAHMYETSLRIDRYNVHRATAKTWNAVVDNCPDKSLNKVDVPISLRASKRVPLKDLPQSFHDDWAAYAAWAHGEDLFADAARKKVLSQNTLDGYFRRLHLAITLLVQSGIEPSSIRGLGDLTNLDAFKTILRRRHEETKGEPSYETFFLAHLLIRIAREWVKVDDAEVEVLKDLAKRLPRPAFQMSQRNKHLVMKFDDSEVRSRFLSTPDRLWHDVQNSDRRGRWRLAEAQAALGIEILMTMPVRLGNLTSLAFEEHLFLRRGGTSTLIVPAEETKTGHGVEFDIPEKLAERLFEYRDEIAATIVGRTPQYLFVNTDGSVKNFASVRYLVQRYLKMYVGIHMNPHAYRHLAAKFILDQSPGAHVLVQHLLGHKSVETTASFYAGLDTRRAGRHHQALLAKAMDEYSTARQKHRIGKGGSGQ